MDSVCAVILAAGKGKRMNSTEFNKVTLNVGGQPIILRNIKILKKSGVKDIVVVVGFAKESIIQLLDESVLIADQEEALGTGHATKSALPLVPETDKYVLVLYGDDAFWFTPKILNKLYETHVKNNADLTFCTTVVENPAGLGRIIRANGKVVEIREEKNASEDEKNIKEVNLGGFLFNKSILEKNIDKISKNEVTEEYYITDMVSLISQGGSVETLQLKNFAWRGINTPEELEEAEQLIS